MVSARTPTARSDSFLNTSSTALKRCRAKSEQLALHSASDALFLVALTPTKVKNEKSETLIRMSDKAHKRQKSGHLTEEHGVTPTEQSILTKKAW